MAISTTQVKTLQDFCNSEPKTITQIAEKLLLSTKQGLMSVYNFFKTQVAKTLFFIEKSEGYVWIRTNPSFFSQNPLDLILKEQSSPKTKNESKRTYEKIEGLKRASPERIEASLKLNRINKFGYYDKSLKQFVYTNPIKQEIDELFQAYCSRVNKERIVLTRCPDGNPVWAQDIKLPYKTRFTSTERQQDNIKGFRAVYKNASKRHMKGVFLTLTSAPKGGKSLWQINRNTRKAWGNFSKFLNRVLPKRAEWIRVSEFQKNGMLHFHVMILGVNWLLHKSVIQYAWTHYGGGYIMDIHTIQNDPVHGWQWSRSCPIEAAGQKPGDFLGSYLEKSMSSNHGSMHWVTGIRNWTCSENLNPKNQQAEKHKPLGSSTKGFIFKGVSSLLTGFRSSKGGQARALYTGKLQQNTPTVKESSKPKQQAEKIDTSFHTAKEITQAYLKTSRGL